MQSTTVMGPVVVDLTAFGTLYTDNSTPPPPSPSSSSSPPLRLFASRQHRRPRDLCGTFRRTAERSRLDNIPARGLLLAEEAVRAPHRQGGQDGPRQARAHSGGLCRTLLLQAGRRRRLFRNLGRKPVKDTEGGGEGGGGRMLYYCTIVTLRLAGE